LDSSFLEGDSREGGVSESLRTPSVASSDLLDELVSGEEGGEEEEEEFWKNLGGYLQGSLGFFT